MHRYPDTVSKVKSFMKAIVCNALAPDLAGVAIADIDIPKLGSHDVLVANRAACVNFPDLLMTEGKYQHRPELPFILGMESAGDVVEIGNAVEGIQRGDKVIVGGKAGAFAEFRVAPSNMVRPIPTGLNYAEAAAHTTGLLTAYVALVRLGDVQQGEAALIHGAAGGVGFAAVKLAQHLGAKVIATGSTEAKRRFLLEQGVEHVLLPDVQLRDAVMRISPNGVGICYDPVGGDLFDASVRCMAFGGRYLVIGFTSGRIPEISINYPLIKGFSVIGVRAGEYGKRFPALGAQNIEMIDALATAGLKPHISREFDLAQGLEALRYLQGRAAIGRIVIAMPD
jgi:NADPH:quinone reductase